MFKKFSLLMILLLLFLSVACVNASDDADMNLTSDEIEVDSLEASDVSDDVLSGEVSVTNSNYGTYFENDGNAKDTIKSGDTVRFSGSFSGKNFTFNTKVNVVGESSTFTNTMFSFLSGASESCISNLNISNSYDHTCGILINGASKCIIQGCTIESTGAGAYPICLANGATYNNVTGNQLKTSGESYGHNTRSTPTLVLFGSNYNTLSDNDIQLDDANAIYLSSYGGGPFVSQESHYNLILNNTIKYNVLPTSWSYAIQTMGSYNTIKANKIIGAYRGISTTGVYNVITENQIINLTGADYKDRTKEVGGEYAIVGSKYSTVSDNQIINAKIISTGSAISVIDHSVVENNYVDVKYVGMGISAAGYNVTIQNNNVSTVSGVGIHEKDDGAGLTITRNNIVSQAGIGILVEQISSKRMPSDVTITYNDIKTNNQFAIDASGVKMDTAIIEDNEVHGKKIISPSGIYDDSKPKYKYNESRTHVITPSNIRDYINPNGILLPVVESGDILKFEGTFSNETVIHVNKAIKMIGNGAVFLNTTFKVTSGSVWIENLTIINKDTERPNAWGIYVNEVPGVKIINNDISVTDPNAAYAIYVLESSYVEVINNTLFSDGDFLTFTLLAYSCEECIFSDNDIRTLGTGEKYRYSPESSIEGNVYNVNGTEVCVDGNIVCIDGVTYCLDGNEVCIDGNVYCLDGDVLIVNGVNYTVLPNNTVCIDGKVYCIDGNTICIDGVTYCLDGTVVCIDGDNLVYNGVSYPIVDNNVTIGDKTYCIDGNTICIDGVTYCIDGNEVCIDGNVYCLDGDVLIVNGVNYTVSPNNTVCIDGVTYCIDGNTICIDGVTYCLDGTVVCIDGDNLVYNGVSYPIVDNNVTIGDKTYCIDGNTICIDGVTYCLDGSVVCIDGVTYCLDGNELVVSGTSYGKTNHMVPEIYRTYGILLLYSSLNNITGNTVNVTSKLGQVYPTTGANGSENSIVGIDIYYNSHGNLVKDNVVLVSAKDNYIYGVGVLGYQTGHTAPEGKGASGNLFIGNNITLVGPYATTGIIIGDESENTDVWDNVVVISSNVTYGINLEGSDDSIIKNNNFTLNSELAYGIEGFMSSNNEVTENTIVANGKQVYGMIFSGNNNDIEENDVFANGTGEEVSFNPHDSLGSGNAGIYLSGNATDNIIKSNSIVSKSGYAIVSESTGNTFEDNYLESEKGNSTAGINGTSGNDVIGNYIYLIDATFEDSTKVYLEEGTFVLKANETLDGANVKFYNGDDSYIGETYISNGEAVLNYHLPDDYTPALYQVYAVVSKEDYRTTESESYLTITKGKLNVAVNDISVKPGLNAKYVVKVTNVLGNPMSNFQVNFRYFSASSKVAFSGKTDANGMLTIVRTLDPAFSTLDEGEVYVEVPETDNYLSGSAISKITVLKFAPITITMNAKVGFGGILAKITDNNGFAVANKDVTVNIGGAVQNLRTNANGEVVLPSAASGYQSVSISSAQNSNYASGSASGMVTVVAPITGGNDANVYFGNTVVYKIRLADKNGNYLGANNQVTIFVNGKAVNLVTDAQGYVSYSVKKVGTYTITAQYNGYSVSNKIVIKPTLIAKNIVKKKAKKIKFSVKLVNKNGKILKKKKVTFKFKGKKYKVKTNKKGIATLTLNKLKVGKYTITSSYGGCTIKNTIRIKK